MCYKLTGRYVLADDPAVRGGDHPRVQVVIYRTLIPFGPAADRERSRPAASLSRGSSNRERAPYAIAVMDEFGVG